MPVERRYKKGSIVYFEHEVGDEIFVLKTGRLDITYTEPQSGEKISRTLHEGEFFGLKSAIIAHSRGEDAEAVTDCICIAFKSAEFESFVSQKVDLMKRLLKVLSNQIRNLGFKVNNYLGNDVQYPPSIGLFKIGEYYLNNKSFKQSTQVYERYLISYPESSLADEAKKRIALAEEAQKTGFLKAFTPVDEIIEAEASGAGMESFAAAQENETVKAAAPSKLGLREFMDNFYRAESFFNGEDYENAEKLFDVIFVEDLKIISTELKNKAKLMQIQTYHRLKKYPECVAAATAFVKTAKDPTMVKVALFVLAEMYLDLGKSGAALQVLDKIQAMSPVDDLTKKAREMSVKIETEV